MQFFSTTIFQPYMFTSRLIPIDRRRMRLPVMSASMSDEPMYSSKGLRHFPVEKITEAGWVLIFNSDTTSEGVYTIQDRSVEITSVLAFESSDDAHRFAVHLFESGFEMATPIRWSAYYLVNFCTSSDFSVIAVSCGHVFIPPEINEFSNDFDRNRLENLLSQTPANCKDDDCIL